MCRLGDIFTWAIQAGHRPPRPTVSQQPKRAIPDVEIAVLAPVTVVTVSKTDADPDRP